MAVTSQSLRYSGPGGASAPSGGSFEALNRILLDLCTHGNPKVWLALSVFGYAKESLIKKVRVGCGRFNYNLIVLCNYFVMLCFRRRVRR